MEATKATQGKVTGVIIPPPEIRAVVDKTASFVAKIGKSFEQRVLNSAEGQTPKFNFMKPFDPYHSYYEMKIREGEQLLAGGTVAAPIEENKASSATGTGIEETKTSSDSNVSNDTKVAAKASVATAAKATILNPIAQLAQTKPTEAPSELEFVVAQSRPAGLTALDLDIIKLAAQYTAVNGREFLATLALREQRNPQYDFLKPTHMLFSYFTYLVDCYAKIVNPSAQMMEQIEERCDWKKAMEVSVRRWQWRHMEEERKRQENSEENEDRAAFQAIDWFDFTVVETIDFPEDELLELPGLSAMDIGAATESGGSKAAVPPPPPPVRGNTASSNSIKNSNSSYYAPLASAMPSSVDVEGEGETEGMQEEEDLSDLRVVSDYQHPFTGSNSGSNTAGASNNTPVMVDPISGKVVPVDQMSEHMRVQLLDPRWRQQQQRFVEKQKETGFAEGGSIADSLKMFARKRGDIFGQAATGTGENSAQAIAEQEALERRKAEIQGQVQWDGHYGSIGSVQQMKHEVVSKAPAAFQLPASAVKPASNIGPAFQSAPVVAHYALPPMAAPAAPVMSMAPPPPPMMPSSMLPPSGAAPPPPPMFPTPQLQQFAPSMPPPPPAAYSTGLAAPPVSMPAPPEPAAKKPRVDAPTEQVLVPAEQFAAQYGGLNMPISIRVQLPVALAEDSGVPSSWNLNGQIVELDATLSSGVKQLKEALSVQHCGGMPTSKQQLRYSALGFLKDAQTLAELNIGPGAVVEMTLKSRGGRR